MFGIVPNLPSSRFTPGIPLDPRNLKVNPTGPRRSGDEFFDYITQFLSGPSTMLPREKVLSYHGNRIGDNYVIEIDVPGIEERNISVSLIKNKNIEVTAVRPEEGREYTGSLTIRLPREVSRDQEIKAHLDLGILTLTIADFFGHNVDSVRNIAIESVKPIKQVENKAVKSEVAEKKEEPKKEDDLKLAGEYADIVKSAVEKTAEKESAEKSPSRKPSPGGARVTRASGSKDANNKT